MKKEEIIDILRNELEKRNVTISKKAASEIIEVIFEEIKNALKNGESVKIPKFGTFKIVETKERKGKIKVNGVEKEWVKPAGKKVKFVTNSIFKKELQG